MVVKQTNLSFEEALKELKDKITDKGIEIFAEFDHQANAEKVDLALRPTTVVVFGDPKAGTSLMVDQALIAYELPLRVLVVAGEEGAKYVYRKPLDLAESYEVSAESKMKLEKMSGLLDLLTTV